mgnify:CR=1 FL=1
MSGSSPTYNYPAQPTYGEGMADAMKSQMEMLTGQTLGDKEGFKELYASALGKEGGNLADIMREFEAPLRKETAQIDTDVMRQTLLGSEQKVVLDPVSGKYGIPGAEAVTSEQMGSDAPTQTAGGRYQIIMTRPEDISIRNMTLRHGNEYAIIDTKTGGMTGVAHADATGSNRVDASGINLKNITDKFNELNDSVTAAAEAGTPETEVKLEYEFTNPNTGKPLQEGDTVRSGDGMVDLVGDSRAVQEQTRSEDYAQYVKDNTDLQDDFNAKRQAGDQRTIEEYGQQHYEASGQAEGRDLPMGEYTLQDAGRQAGFDPSGEFMGLSALSEDIARGGQQRAREADIADVERLGGRATDAYRAQGDLSGALANARNMGALGDLGLSAIPADPLFDGVATNSLAARTALENANISAITGGRTGDYDPRALPPIQRPMYTSEGGEQPVGLEQATSADPFQASLERSPAIAAPRSRDSAQGSGVMSPGTFQIPQQGQAAANQQVGAAGLGQMQGQGQQAQQYAQPGGTDAFRSALMQQGMGALDQGLSERENRAVQEAARARSTNMGRTFDQTASIDESRAVIEEDNARRMQNRAFAQSALGQEVGIQQADMARGLQAQQMELGRQSAGVDRQLTAEEKDIERQMRMQAMEEQYRQQGLGAERANAAQMVGLEQATSADPFQAILQRQGQNNLASGGAVFGQAGYGLDSGPQYLNPESGLGFIQNQSTNAANMYNAQVGADATRSAGMWSGLGALGGGLLTGGVGTAAGKGLKSLFS